MCRRFKIKKYMLLKQSYALKYNTRLVHSLISLWHVSSSKDVVIMMLKVICQCFPLANAYRGRCLNHPLLRDKA